VSVVVEEVKHPHAQAAAATTRAHRRYNEAIVDADFAQLTIGTMGLGNGGPGGACPPPSNTSGAIHVIGPSWKMLNSLQFRHLLWP